MSETQLTQRCEPAIGSGLHHDRNAMNLAVRQTRSTGCRLPSNIADAAGLVLGIVWKVELD